MDDLFLEIRKRLACFLNLESWRVRLRGLSKSKKRNTIAIIILVLCMRLFFYNVFEGKAHAETLNLNEDVDFEIIDPMNKIDKGIMNPEKIGSREARVCDEKDKNDFILKNIETDKKKETLNKMLGGYPMEKMIPYLAGRDEKTAAFLVAIAKKESSWGQHAPSKSGRDCYNYWGYKGSYNLAMGYSCFDSPEHAIKVVGDKIDDLIAKKIDTPARMVVWKCGSSCAGHSPESVQSWIGTVDMYLKKMMS
jgi:hypothetical protein